MSETGFEVAGEFYSWSISDNAKDLMLIDRFTQLPAHEFFDLIEDPDERGRGPILLAMIATSIRGQKKDWSVERIHRTVMNLNMGDVTFVGGDEDQVEVDAVGPPVKGAVAPEEESGETSSET